MSAKQKVALDVLEKEVVDVFRSVLAAAKIGKIGKGCIRLTKPDGIDFEVIRKLLIRTAEPNSAPC